MTSCIDHAGQVLYLPNRNEGLLTDQCEDAEPRTLVVIRGTRHEHIMSDIDLPCGDTIHRWAIGSRWQADFVLWLID